MASPDRTFLAASRPGLVRRSLVRAALVVGGLTAASTLAVAQPNSNEQAEALNNSGKTLIKQLDLVGAAAEFRAALALSNDPRFAFNLCYTLEKSGLLEEAKVACELVVSSGDSRLGNKANRLLASIEERLDDGPPPPPPPIRAPLSGQSRAAPNSSVQGPTSPGGPPLAPEPTPEPKTTRFGALVGISRSNMAAEFDVDPKVGVALGGMVAVNLRPTFETILDVQLVNRGLSARGFEGQDVSLTTTYVDVGLVSRWYIGEGAFTPYVEAGAAISLLLSASAEFAGQKGDADVAGFDFAYALALGTRVSLGSRSLDFRARYLYGLLDTTKAEPGVASESAYNRALLIQGGMWF